MRAGSRVLLAATCVAVAAACGSPAAAPPAAPADSPTEVLAWANAGAEKTGMDALSALFASSCPGQRYVNPAIAPGAPADPQQLLAARLKDGPAPASFQVHPGAEARPYVAAGQLAGLTGQFAQWGLDTALPAGLRAGISVDGTPYAVPAGLDRMLLWSNTSVLARAGVTGQPAGLAGFVANLEALRKAGVEHPLALGSTWTQLELLEGVLLAELGPQRFTALWSATADWSGADVTHALTTYKTLLSYTNPDRDQLAWNDAATLVRTGKAGYVVVGDWVLDDWGKAGFTDYAYQPMPGTEGTFQWLGDSFVLPKASAGDAGANCWLKTVGSVEGQKAFTTLKGAIPARTDVDPAGYPPYQQAAMADLRRLTLVPSCAHGSACTQAETAAVTVAVAQFSGTGDVAGLQKAVGAAVAGNGPASAAR